MSNLDAVKQFEKKVNAIHDTDYGDFRRKAQGYLNHLKKEIEAPTKAMAMAFLKVENTLSYEGDAKDVDEVRMNIQSFISSLQEMGL